MGVKNNLFFIVLLLILVLFGVSNGQQSEARGKRISVKGRIIGYSLRSRLRSVQGQVISPPRDAFLFLVDEGNDELKAGSYIKIQYRVTREHHEELPAAFFEEGIQRRFVLERDETCDELTESFLDGDRFTDEESGIDAAKRFPNLRRLPGVENVRLPKDGRVRCFTFSWAGIE